jgi:hypothetical protein
MPDLPSFDDLFRIGRDEMLARNAKLTEAVVDTPGTETNIFNAAAAAVGDEVTGQLALVAASLFLDSATGQDLDRLVFDRYGIVRKVASAAVGSVNFSLAAPAAGAFSIPAGTVLGTSDGRQYITTVTTTFPAGTAGPITVAIRSVLAGSSQQAAIGTITSIITPITGAPAGLAVTNAVATAGATDDETDDSLRARARSFFTTARRGTIAAIQSRALDIAGVVTATAFEVLDMMGRPSRAVQLIIADQFTDSLVNLSPTPATYQTQSQILSQQVFDGLSDTRAAGIFINVRVASVVIQPVQLALSFLAGADIAATTVAARAAIVAYVNSLPSGAPMTVTSLISVLRGVQGLVVTGTEIVSPTGDVITQPLQVLRTSMAFVLAVGQLPDQAIQSTSNPDSL